MNYYILDDEDKPVRTDFVTFSRWMDWEVNKRVARTELPGGVVVSTVFLGLDHNWGKGPPILFETMIFGGEKHEYQERARTKKEALEVHRRTVELLRLEGR